MPWKQLAGELAKLENVISVFAVSGDNDIMIEVVVKDMEHFSNVVLTKVLILMAY